MKAACENLIFSSLRRLDGGALCLRVFDTGGNPREATLKLAGAVPWARKTRIDGTVIRELSVTLQGKETRVQVPVDPWEIITVELGGNP
ncbi:MAG: glycosyl hydrolase-related protein [Spirochaetia bacterium]|jgi:hypothetical protein